MPFLVRTNFEEIASRRFVRHFRMERGHALRRGHPGRGFAQPLVNKALRLRRHGKKEKGQPHTSWKSISAQIGAFSPNTPRRWAHKDMSASARAMRLKNCGHKRLLSEADQQVAAGWFISRCLRRLNTTTANARLFFKSAFNLDILSPWLSNFAARHHLSVRVGKRCKSLEVRGAAYHEAVKFLAELHSLEKSPGQILALDKTSVYTSIDRMGHWGPKGRYVIFLRI